MPETLEERLNRLRQEGRITAPPTPVSIPTTAPATVAPAQGFESLEDRLARLRKSGAIQTPVAQEESLVGKWAQSFGRAAEKGGEFVQKFGTPEGWKAGAEALRETGTALAPVAAGALLFTPARAYAKEVMRAGGGLLSRQAGAAAAREGARNLAAVGIGAMSGMAGGKVGENVAKVMGGGEEAQEFGRELGAAVGVPTGGLGAWNKLRKVDPNIAAPAGMQGVADEIVRLDTKIKGQAGKLQAPKKLTQRAKDTFDQNFVEAEAPITRRMKTYLKDAGVTKEDYWKTIDRLENAMALARRPNEPFGLMAEEAGIEQAVAGIGKKNWGDLEGLTRYEQRLRAKIELDGIARGKVKALPVDASTPDLESRIRLNQEIVKGTQDLAGYDKNFRKLADDFLDFQVREGLLSAQAAQKIKANGADVWVKQIPILDEDEILKIRNATGDPLKDDDLLMGAGKRKPVYFLEDKLEREAQPVLEATFKSMQAGIKQAAKNRAIKEFAMEAAPGDAGAATLLGRDKGGRATDLKLFKDRPSSKKSMSGDPLKVFVKGEQYWLDGPADFVAGVKMLGAEGITSLDSPLAKEALNLARGLNRATKGQVTGAFAPQWILFGTLMNLGSVLVKPVGNPLKVIANSLRSLPAAAAYATGSPKWKAKYASQPWVKEGRRKAAFGTSSEVFRGAGPHDLEILSMTQNRNPLETVGKLAKWGILEPARERLSLGSRNIDVLNRPGRLAKEALRSFEDTVNIPQTALSMGVYRTALADAAKKGFQPEEAAERAAWVARNFMADYTRRGSNSAIAELISPYYNAIVQGGRSGLMFAERDPKKMASRMVYLTAPALLATLVNYSDPEVSELLDTMPPDERAKYVPIKTGPIEKDENGDYKSGFFLAPVPEEFRYVNVVMDTAVRTLRERDELPQALAGMVVTALNNASPVPLDPAQMTQNIPVLGLGTELSTGRRLFGGAPIVTPRNIEDTPEGLRDLLGVEGGTKAWYGAKRVMPALRNFSGEATGPLGRFTSVRGGWRRGQERKERERRLLEMRYGREEE